MIRFLLWAIGSLMALLGIGWLGFQVPPQNFDPPAVKSEDLGTVPAPTNLPAPVQRYIRAAFGDKVPRVDTFAAWGRARANFGLWMPLRYRLYHIPGCAFKREMELTWFGIPLLKALDQFIGGKGVTGPLNNLSSGPAVDQGANMILWAEATLMPSLLVSDPRIRWESVDETTARLVFPLHDEEDEMLFHFDPQTGLPTSVSALRYRDANGGKIPWRADTLAWQTVNGVKVPARVAIMWEDQGQYWSYWDFEHIAWNIDITAHLAEEGTEFAPQND